MKHILLYIWQLPQIVLGLLLRAIYKGHDSVFKDAIVRRSTKFLGGISLGKYIIVNQWAKRERVMHEYGHCVQSKRWGWLYLPVVGLSSLIHTMLCKEESYLACKFWTERRANEIMGLTVKK